MCRRLIQLLLISPLFTATHLPGAGAVRLFPDWEPLIDNGLIDISRNTVPRRPFRWHRHGGESSAEAERVTTRPDPMASVAAGGESGELRTLPLLFDGGELLLNASVAAGGRLRVEIQSSDGHPLPGYSLIESALLRGDDAEQPARWNGSPDLKRLAGTPVRLRFDLQEADLHAIRFRDPDWRQSYPVQVRDITFRSSADQSLQPALFYRPQGNDPVPLLLSLHSWSGNYYQTSQGPFAQWCVDHDWAFIHPDFRGPNRNRNACGSELAVVDITDAVAWARTQARIDPSRIYLAGTSGGGHMALLMAGRAPNLWTAVSAWVGISDLAAWYRQCREAGRHYAKEIVLCCGAPPGTGAGTDAEYSARSPLTHLRHAAAAGIPIDINAGIHDGHTGSVPISQSLHAFNALALPADRIPVEAIEYMTQHAEVMPSLRQPDLSDPSYGDKRPLFRKTSGPVRVTLFDGGHEVIPSAALHWLSRHRSLP